MMNFITFDEREASLKLELQGVLDAFPASIAILDSQGTIVLTNESWRSFARENRADSLMVNEGANYLSACEGAKGDGEQKAKALASSIRKILRRELKSFQIDYTCDSPSEKRWFTAHAKAYVLNRQPHCMVFHIDITRGIGPMREIHDNKDRLACSLCQKNEQLSKAHHRGRNTMQMISSLIGLHSAFFNETTTVSLFNELRDRIQSIALVHDNLHQTTMDLAQLSLDVYIKALLEYLVRANPRLSSGIRIITNLDVVKVPVDTAAPIGLILNELINNAIRHAFSDRSSGELSLTLRQERPNETIFIEVRDNGKGMPESFDWRHSATLGMSIVMMLTRQIRGVVDASSSRAGTAFNLCLNMPQSRPAAESRHV